MWGGGDVEEGEEVDVRYSMAILAQPYMYGWSLMEVWYWMPVPMSVV